MKTVKYQELLRTNLKDSSFRKEYDALEKEFILAREVIELRSKRNLTQRQLAQLMGTSQPAIARLESGNYRNVSLSFLRRLAEALGAVTEVHLRTKTSEGTQHFVAADFGHTAVQ